MKKFSKSAPGWYNAEKPPETPAKIEVEIDGEKHVFTPDDVVNLKKQQASATQKTQQVATILQAAEKYGMTTDELLSQTEGAFSVMSDLIDKGVINEKGELIAKPSAGDPPVPGAPPAIAPADLSPSKLKAIETTMKGLETLTERLQRLEQDQAFMLRSDMSRQIKSKHPDLDDEDVSKVLAAAMKDPEKASIWEHAGRTEQQKKALAVELRKKHAEEFGINIDKFDENKLHEQSGTGASGLFKDKKFTFKKGSRKGSDALSPMEATKEFMDRQAK